MLMEAALCTLALMRITRCVELDCFVNRAALEVLPELVYMLVSRSAAPALLTRIRGERAGRAVVGGLQSGGRKRLT